MRSFLLRPEVADSFMTLFAALLSVSLGYFLARLQQRRQEKRAYVGALRSLLSQSVYNNGVLIRISKRTSKKSVPACHFHTTAIQTALLNPNFMLRSGHSLVHILGVVQESLLQTSVHYDHVMGAMGRAIKLQDHHVGKLQDNAKRALGFNGVLQRELDRLLAEAKAQPRVDPHYNRLRQELFNVEEEWKSPAEEDN